MPQCQGAETLPTVNAVPAVSVVVPVFNAMPYLQEMLESLAAQDLNPQEFEVLLVDDGSTDGGSDYMDEFASRHPNVKVLHQENHGWPGQPRNVGIASTAGKYLFFADADDVLAPQALRELVTFADAHGSDIVIPSMAGTHGRVVPSALYLTTELDVPLPKAFKTLGPIKLYRRSLLTENDIRFPVKNVRLEDGIFNTKAYLKARRISLLGGETLYFVRKRDDGQNISSRGFEPAGYTTSIAYMCSAVGEAALDPKLIENIILGLYQRKCLKIYAPGRFERYTANRRREWLDAHGRFIDQFVPTSAEARLSEPFRSRSALVRKRDAEGLLELGRNEAAPKVSSSFCGGQFTESGALELWFEASIIGRYEMPPLICEIRHRGNTDLLSVPADGDVRIEFDHFRPGRFRSVIAKEALEAMGAGTHDFFLTAQINRKFVSSRVRQRPGSILPVKDVSIQFYVTRLGNLSLSISH